MNNHPFEVLVKLPWYTEGPVVDKEGNIFFTTLKGGTILQLNNQGRITEWAKGGTPNGQILVDDDLHLVCDSGTNAIARYSADGKLLRYDIHETCAGEKINCPNDLVEDKDGGIFFTDSIRTKGKVCYYHPDGEQKIIARDLDFPNGIVISKDGKLLLVAESYTNRILAFDIKDNFRQTVFAELPKNPSGEIIGNLPDGIRIDEEGKLWVAHYGMGCVQILSPEGKWERSINVDFPLASNLFLNGNQLIVTGGYGEPGPGGVVQKAV